MTERDKYEDATIIEMHRLYTRKVDLAVIAKTLEITPQSLKNWFKQLGLPLHHQGGFNKNQRRVPVIDPNDYKTKTLEELAKQYVLSKSSVLRILKENGTPRKGRGWHKSKTTQPVPPDTVEQSSEPKSHTS